MEQQTFILGGGIVFLASMVILGGCAPAPEAPVEEIQATVEPTQEPAPAAETRSADYTIVVTHQKSECFIFPDDSTVWEIPAKTTIRFVNTTGVAVQVKAYPDAYTETNTFTLGAYESTIKTIIQLPPGEDKRAIQHDFYCDPLEPDKAVAGGPKMIVTGAES